MTFRMRRFLIVILALAGVATFVFANPESYEQVSTRLENIGGSEALAGDEEILVPTGGATLASEGLELLEVKGRAPKTGYTREEFYNGWPTVDGCNLRQKIIKREFGDSAVLDGCNVISGEYDEPYTGKHLTFSNRDEISKGIQIDHVVALSDAWQKGAQYKTAEERFALATDPLNLLAVDSSTNQQKSDGDAATWLPPNKAFRCQYVARQVSVKYKYGLWVTQAEHDAIANVLENCPTEPAVGI